MKNAIEAYKEHLLNGVDSTTTAQVIQAQFGLSNADLSIVADSGRRDARVEWDNIRELGYASIAK